jgi:WD40 repeat protein
MRVWDAAGGRERQRLQGHTATVVSVAWSPDGSLLASSSYDNTMRVWDIALGRERQRLEGHTGTVQTLAWSPEGSRLVSGSYDKTVRLWDAARGREQLRMQRHTEWINGVAWSSDGRRVASASEDQTVRVWDAADGRELHRLQGHAGGVRSVEWSSDGSRLVSGSYDRTVRLWDAVGRRERQRLESHTGVVQSVAWSPDGNRVASAPREGEVRVWDAASGEEQQRLGNRDGFLSVAWSPDGSRVAGASYSDAVWVWDAMVGRELQRFEGYLNAFSSVAWSPDGKSLAGGSYDKTVRLWDVTSGQELRRLEGHGDAVDSVAWSPDGKTVASGARDKTVRLWDPDTGRQRLVLEGHQYSVARLAWSKNSRFLASLDERCALKVWEIGRGEQILDTSARTYRHLAVGLEFGSTAEWDNGEFFVAQADANAVFVELANRPRQVLQTSAKIVLAGDSSAGKTCLARRLAENDYVEGQPTTHGMQIWTMPPEGLDRRGAAPPGQAREVFLWDLGGQSEYQLVNQLFLRDTTVALILFDAKRGNVGLESAEAWHERLSAHANCPMQNLLIATKADEPGIVHADAVEALRARLGFRCAIPVSSKQEGDQGVAELRRELHQAIDWDNLTRVSRPQAFHAIRGYLANARQSGETVIFVADLEKRLAKAGVRYESGEFETTLGHLVREGQIVDIRLQSGDRVLVLRIDIISRYAGSVVQAARTSPTRVPALAKDQILSSAMEFPGLAAGERLSSRNEELTVLQCVARLMVERGLCFDHEGMLVFPTLFSELAEHEGTLPPSAPVYYDFSGPIDNIYASMVAKLAVSDKFGPVRLWARYAEFGSEARGTFGIRRADKSKGKGHLDLFLSGPIDADRQKLFRDFVDDHLTSQGVKILSGLAFSCRNRDFEFSEDLLAGRLAEGKTAVTCPRCDEKYSLFAADTPATQESQGRLSALKTDIEARTKASAARVTADVAQPRTVVEGDPILLLHLSDLHFSADMKVDSLLQPLEADLREILQDKRLDYLVISGDFADKCNERGWEVAAEFVSELRMGFALDALRIILAPGNHDLVQSSDYFTFTVDPKRIVHDSEGKARVEVEPTPNEKYPTRFHRFATFYHNLYSAKPYSEDPALQFDLMPGEGGLHILALNSAWQVDQFYPERASLNNDALSSGLREAGKVPLGIAVWHHAASGDRKIKETDATERLADAGFRIVLHGDVHHERADALHYLVDARRIHVIGSGSFGASKEGRPESTPRSYSLLRIRRDLKHVEVERRHQRTAEGPYELGRIYSIPLE